VKTGVDDLIARGVTAEEIDALPRTPPGATATGGEEDRPGGERFTDREHARLFEAFSAGGVRHADEMGERWYQVGQLRWSLDFKTAIVPYVQRVVNHFFACSDQERAAAHERRTQVPTNKRKKGAAA
jgi:hypothetical protein